MYPARSLAWGFAPNSFWFYVMRSSGQPTGYLDVGACAGGDVVVRLQEVIRARLTARGNSLPSIGGRILAAEIPTGGVDGWGDKLLRGLWAIARDNNLSTTLLNAIERDIREHTVSPESLQVGVWETWDHTELPHVGQIVMPRDVALPPFGKTLPRPIAPRRAPELFNMKRTNSWMTANKVEATAINPGWIGGFLVLLLGGGAVATSQK